MKEAGVTWGSLEASTLDRVKWKQFIAVPHPDRQRLKSIQSMGDDAWRLGS